MNRRKMLNPEGPKHTGVRSVLRVAGPVVLVIGVLLVGSGVYEIMAGDPFNSPGGMFVRMFLGMPMVFVGLVMTKLAFVGALMRYGANEVAPVGRDTVNYMVDGTKGSMRDAAAAVAGGLREGMAGEADTPPPVACRTCGHANDADAKFCDDCGQPIRHHTACVQCGTENDIDARFCDNCGQAMQTG